MRVIAGIATTGKRERLLENTINSLKGQVDKIYIYNNSKSKDLTDNGKFWALQHEKDCVYLSCDDDIIYPRDYAKTCIEWIEKKECIISWHGRVLKDTEKYYKGKHEEMRFFQESKGLFLSVAGTGVSAFHTKYFCPEIWNSEYKRMSDLVFSLEARKQGKIIYSPPKKHLWIIPQESTGIAQETTDQTQQIELMRQIMNE